MWGKNTNQFKLQRPNHWSLEVDKLIQTTHYSECNDLSKKTSKLHITGLCERNPSVIPLTKACNAENVSIWWLRHEHYANESRFVLFGNGWHHLNSLLFRRWHMPKYTICCINDTAMTDIGKFITYAKS